VHAYGCYVDSARRVVPATRFFARRRFVRALHNEELFTIPCDVIRAALHVFDFNRQSFGFAECQGKCRLYIDRQAVASRGENNLLSVRCPKRTALYFPMLLVPMDVSYS
jgi:hypothetical protein